MSFSFLIFLLFLGLVLILIEAVVFQGILISGLVGLGLILISVVLAYSEFGSEIGNMVVLGSGLTIIGVLILAYFMVQSKGVSLDTELEGRVNEQNTLDADVSIGTQGIAFGDLKPMGKAQLNGEVFQVRSRGEFITDDSKIEVVDIGMSELIVKAI